MNLPYADARGMIVEPKIIFRDGRSIDFSTDSDDVCWGHAWKEDASAYISRIHSRYNLYKT